MNVPTKPLNKPLFNKQCRVCGDKATCFNFNGLSCETCKIFFRRNAANGDKLKCRRDGNCPIDCFTRKCCPKCRLDKCFAIGMRFKTKKSLKNSIESNDSCSSTLNDSSCSETDAIEHPPISSSKSLHTFCSMNNNKQISMSDSESSTDHEPLTRSFSLPIPQMVVNPNFELTDYEIELIQEIQNATRVFVDEDKLPLVGETSELVLALNQPGIYLSRIARFTKQIAPFNQLNPADQLFIVKEFYFEILSIRFAYFYDMEKDGFPVIENESGKKGIIIKISTLKNSKHERAEEIGRDFLTTLKDEMENDPIIRDILITQFLFKPREQLSCPEIIRYHYCVYRHLLVKYLEYKYQNTPQASRKYAKLMTLLSDYGIVKEIIRDLLVDLGTSQVSHILAEVFNLNSAM